MPAIVDHLNLLLAHQLAVGEIIVRVLAAISRVNPVTEDAGALVLIPVHDLLGQLLPLQFLTDVACSAFILAEVRMVVRSIRILVVAVPVLGD